MENNFVLPYLPLNAFFKTELESFASVHLPKIQLHQMAALSAGEADRPSSQTEDEEGGSVFEGSLPVGVYML